MLSVLYEEKITLELEEVEYLHHLKSKDVRHFELGIDAELYKRFNLKKNNWKDFDFAYHIPYHTGETYLPEFIKEQQSKKAYEAYFTFIDRTRFKETPTVVVHAGMSKNTDENLAYLDYLLNRTEQLGLGVRFALETIRSKDGTTAYTRDDIRVLINPFRSSRLKMCADLTHEYRTDGVVKGYEEDIIHTHFHGFTETTAHHSLTKENKMLFEEHLGGYVKKVPTVLENLYEEGYLEKLLYDLDWINHSAVKKL
ncbi:MULTISPECIES: TIM barrel protein [unclassified Fusibacter]|uniref:TIM barrel protein n=1 Tax=unclassified Fusibacter TaxID=2624464 RepID=UPI001010635A|nr:MULTISPECIES: TIM barrel protein [unclassified Fusibacter]MCK8059509.1 sugar phosphate isomerase/epimerase [Fusibacter sp. A2]NPE21027.1 hypothetical protein [Fusibacter sp. A1]RXV62301.1 hypothetical protein DWB64_04270 [Fusibacter sp. A1]